MNRKNKDMKFYIIVGLVLIAVIIGTYLFQEKYVDPILDERTMSCIANNSMLFATTTCSYCKDQKEILGNYTEMFNIIYCDEDTTGICAERGIELVPFWVIDNQGYIGTKTVEELQNLIGC